MKSKLLLLSVVSVLLLSSCGTKNSSNPTDPQNTPQNGDGPKIPDNEHPEIGQRMSPKITVHFNDPSGLCTLPESFVPRKALDVAHFAHSGENEVPEWRDNHVMHANFADKDVYVEESHSTSWTSGAVATLQVGGSKGGDWCGDYMSDDQNQDPNCTLTWDNNTFPSAVEITVTPELTDRTAPDFGKYFRFVCSQSK